MSPRIAGLREYRGEIVADAVWPGIISRADHERVVEVLSDPSRRRTGPTRRYLLTGGVAKCGLCGVGLVARPRDDGRRTLICATGPNFEGCGKIRILAEPLDELVAEAIFLALDGEGFTRAIRGLASDAADSEVARGLASDESALEELAVARFSERVIGEREYLAARASLVERIEGARRQLTGGARARVIAQVPGGEALRRWWAEAGIDRRRGLVDAVLESVTIGPAVRGRNRFDPDRVGLVWRA